MPPKDVDEDRLHAGIRQQHAERLADLAGARAAADVQEVGRLASGELDDVHRRHREPGAVHHAADRAVQADVVQAVPGGLDLQRILFGRVAQLGMDGVPEVRAVVQGHLGVEGQHGAVARHYERVDLDERRVQVVERPRPGRHDAGRPERRRARQAEAEREPPRLERLEPAPRHGLAVDAVGRGRRDLLYRHAARRAGDDHEPLRFPIDEQPEVELRGDVERLLYQQPAHRPARRARLRGNQRASEQRLGHLCGLARAGDDTHPAALAAPAGVNLRLDHDPAAKTLRRRARLVRGDATSPRGTGMPKGARSALAWYSWSFTIGNPSSSRNRRPPRRRWSSPTRGPRPRTSRGPPPRPASA